MTENEIRKDERERWAKRFDGMALFVEAGLAPKASATAAFRAAAKTLRECEDSGDR